MKTRLMAALAAVTLLLVTMPGLAAAAKPVPTLTLTTQLVDCNGEGTDTIRATATWADIKGPNTYMYRVLELRYADGKLRGAEGIVSTPNDGELVLPNVYDPDRQNPQGTPNLEMRLQVQLVRKNGRTLTDLEDTGWFGCDYS